QNARHKYSLLFHSKGRRRIGQINLEVRSLSGNAAFRNESTMAVDDPAHEVQSKAITLLVGRDECIEDFLFHLHGNTGAIIAEMNHYVSAAGVQRRVEWRLRFLRADRDFPLRLIEPQQRIGNQFVETLGETPRIAKHLD